MRLHGLTERPSDHPYEVEVERVRRQLDGEGRSENLLRLFDYLLAHSQDVRAPKEIEIAFEVFGKDVSYDTSQDAMVRVYVHRLRGRLDAIYHGTYGPRLTIPKGEYRIALVGDVPPPTSEDHGAPSEKKPQATDQAPQSAAPASRSLKKFSVFAFILTALGWSVLFYMRGGPSAQPARSISSFGSMEKRCGAPVLVVGDSYLYFQSRAGDHSPRLIMRPAIQSAAQLDAIRSGEEAKGAQIRDRDDYYMSADSADGVWSLLRAQSDRDHDKVAVPTVLPISKFTSNMLDGGNVIYFGRLDQLGALHDLVFQASHFTFDPVSDTLRDPKHQREFKAQLTEAINESDRNPFKRPAFAYDYGYFAQITKPDGCALWVIAGLEDSALPQMARIANEHSQLETLFHQSHGAPSFEALYEIRSLGALRYKSRRLFVHSLKTAH